MARSSPRPAGWTPHQLLLRAFRLREIADYQVGVQIDGEVVQDLLEGGKRFVAAASAYLDGLT